ncbi:hypothetical protein RvY_16407 [Ramazzottius varieornatus]|uniref:Uncharacterized protein n=1 Tax=Ramazzottius varieornatus TaxID=947166 RepID=A0A1D1VYC9_RAMVA|nr:hypothetical protein RvY_16407 [Ramazzottius varieornatus]
MAFSKKQFNQNRIVEIKSLYILCEMIGEGRHMNQKVLRESELLETSAWMEIGRPD